MTRRVPQIGEGAVADWVDRENRRFKFPFPQPQTQRPALGGGGGAPTVVVAASDASEMSKSKADFVCVGINDQDTIMTAINSMNGASAAGRLVLTEGVFNCTFPTSGLPAIWENNVGGLTIIGMGRDVTFITVTGEPQQNYQEVIELQLNGSGVRDLSIYAAATTAPIVGIFLNGNFQWVDHVTVDGFGGTGGTWDGGVGILCEQDWPQITSVIITDSDNGIVSDGPAAVFINDSLLEDCVTGVKGTGTQVIIEGCYIESTGRAIHNLGDSDWVVIGNKFVASGGCLFDVGADNTLIANNRFDTGGQILFDGGVFTGCVVAGNVWDIADTPTVDGVIVFDNGATDCAAIGNVIADAGGMDGIRIETGTDVVVAVNFIQAADIGIHINSGTRVTVDGNTVKYAGEHGIDYAGSDGTVRNNLVFASSQNTTNTFDNLTVAGNANLITTNHLIPAPSSPLTRRGVTIASGNDNAVYANHLGDSSDYGTADSADSGTGTQVSPAAGVIGGQFAY